MAQAPCSWTRRASSAAPGLSPRLPSCTGAAFPRSLLAAELLGQLVHYWGSRVRPGSGGHSEPGRCGSGLTLVQGTLRLIVPFVTRSQRAAVHRLRLHPGLSSEGCFLPTEHTHRQASLRPAHGWHRDCHLGGVEGVDDPTEIRPRPHRPEGLV